MRPCHMPGSDGFCSPVVLSDEVRVRFPTWLLLASARGRQPIVSAMARTGSPLCHRGSRSLMCCAAATQARRAAACRSIIKLTDEFGVAPRDGPQGTDRAATRGSRTAMVRNPARASGGRSENQAGKLAPAESMCLRLHNLWSQFGEPVYPRKRGTLPDDRQVPVQTGII